MNHKVDEFINNLSHWQEEISKLRMILLDCQLNEELKWRQPCYTFNTNNIALIGNFKEYCTISFFKGVLLSDEEGILVSPGENSQTVKMIKVKSLKEIEQLETVIKSYIFEAIEVEKAGLKVQFTKSTNLDFPEELLDKFSKDEAFRIAFEGLTPGRQRAYNIHFSGAKQSQTRIDRIEKLTDRILKGIGINDCTCGLSKRKPNCDGSHKILNQ